MGGVRLGTGLAAIAVVLAAGCGSGEDGPRGAAGSEVDRLLDQARMSATRAGTVRVVGTVADRGYRTTMDLRLTHGRGGAGRVEHGERSYELIRVGPDLYIKGLGEAFGDLGREADRLLQGKYLHVSATDPNYLDFTAYTQWETFFEFLPAAPRDATRSRLVVGTRTTGVVDEEAGRVLWLSRGSAPRLQRITALDPLGPAEVVEFSRYGESWPLRPPPAGQVVELSELEGAIQGGAPAAD